MDLDRWIENKHATKWKVPDKISLDMNQGIKHKVDVVTGGGHVFYNQDPIICFMGPEIITKYRYPAKNVHGDDK